MSLIKQVLTLTTLLFLISASPNKQNTPSILKLNAIKPLPRITLSTRNTLSFNQVFTKRSITKLQFDLLRMSLKLSPKEPIYLVLYTPGGYVDPGLRLFETIASIPQEVKTITIFAASMGFHLVQNAGERLATPYSALMSHRPSMGIKGEYFGELNVRLKHAEAKFNRMDQVVSNRIGMPLADYRKLIADEYWIHGFAAKRDNMIDRVVIPKCDASLQGTYTQLVSTFFGKFYVTYSKCPLLTYPLKVSTKKPRMLKLFNSFYTNPSDFYKKYIKNNECKKIFRN